VHSHTAHIRRGELFLDELSEFRKNVLEVLRQPMEDGSVTLSRAATTLSFPARFMLPALLGIAAMRRLMALRAAGVV
jgi:predicted ATPase with chaperone activity